MIKLDHITIKVRDYRAARDWYVRLLGLKQEFELPNSAAALQDDSGFTLFVEQATSNGTEPPCVLYFQVEDVEAKYRDLIREKMQIIHSPEKHFWGYGVELQDLDGYRLRLWDEKSMKEKGDDT